MIVKIPEDIDKYEPKTWGNFTTRQFVSILIAFPVLAVIFGGLFYLTGDTTISSIVALVISLPIFMSGFAKTQGLYFNEIIKRRLEDKKNSNPRPYVSQNLYCDLENTEKLIEEFEKEREETDETKKKKNISKKKAK